jgi:spore coat polysaccharide biosynthesis predicted glycosyltransferase SpsG
MAEVGPSRRVRVDLAVIGGSVPSVDLSAFSSTAAIERADHLGVDEGDVVIFDGYGFGEEEYDRAGRAGATVVALDDHGKGSFPVDVLVDIDAREPRAQHVRADTVRLHGPSYALVRREFVERRRSRPLSPDLPVVAVSFGGSDPTETGVKVVEVLGDMAVQTLFVRGPYAPEVSLPSTVRVVDGSAGFADLIDGVDIVVGAAGNTAFELATMGQVSVLMPVAPNQERVAALFGGSGAARVVDTPHEVPGAVEILLDPEVHAAAAGAARDLVDGRGADRLFDALVTAHSRGG